ncbi:hypothetical protein Tcan_11539 [Toxocara canis]|uniref:Uncharacterized protein n=2 Tax=Toxocara canis TaxID=6265 RepID=A0A0B2UWZ8_TOXCA|nr:hypothetical protein Tcan_11539 [Toxocara canis]
MPAAFCKFGRGDSLTRSANERIIRSCENICRGNEDKKEGVTKEPRRSGAVQQEQPEQRGSDSGIRVRTKGPGQMEQVLRQEDDSNDMSVERNNSNAQPTSNGSVDTNGTHSQNDDADTVVITTEQAYEMIIQFANTNCWKEAFERVMAKTANDVQANQAECRENGDVAMGE